MKTNAWWALMMLAAMGCAPTLTKQNGEGGSEADGGGSEGGGAPGSATTTSSTTVGAGGMGGFGAGGSGGAGGEVPVDPVCEGLLDVQIVDVSLPECSDVHGGARRRAR
ncbi:MAG: hypothetical protein KC731_26130 [Myxococcales bacterium]|nr:hypothetical protein [Myxococcales bacterium]